MLCCFVKLSPEVPLCILQAFQLCTSAEFVSQVLSNINKWNYNEDQNRQMLRNFLKTFGNDEEAKIDFKKIIGDHQSHKARVDTIFLFCFYQD